MNDSLVAVELFSGAGGLSLGLKNAGFNVVLANEIEKDFAKTYTLNHPQTKMICDDIHNIDFKEEQQKGGFGDVFLVSGGPPCQGFSTVGSKNRQDARNSLFYEFLRAVSELEPKFVIFENVSGFKKMYNGEVYDTLLRELDTLGFYTNAKILNASDFGLPQNRERAIVLGWRKGLDGITFPSPIYTNVSNLFNQHTKLTLMDAISDLPALDANDFCEHYALEPQNHYQASLRGDTAILTEHNSSNYGEKMREILSLIPPGGTINDLPERLRPKKYFGNTYARLYPDRPSPTITRNFGTPSSSRCVHPFQNRALSTREGARLQGFPDSYQFYGSKTSKNLQIGNAVPPILGEVIAKEIIKSVQTEKQKEAVAF